MCEEWKNDFSAFERWAFESGYDEFAKQGECTIDRINNDGNYEPSNCRWVNMQVQYYNRDVPKPMAEIAKEHELTYDAVHQRMKKNGIPLETALKKPLRRTVRITINGVSKTVKELARETGIPESTIYARTKRGLENESVLRTHYGGDKNQKSVS